MQILMRLCSQAHQINQPLSNLFVALLNFHQVNYVCTETFGIFRPIRETASLQQMSFVVRLPIPGRLVDANGKAGVVTAQQL
jgi:hypothetical protein